MVNQSISMRVAIVAALTKEGGEEFRKMVDEVFGETTMVKVVKASELAGFGLKEIK